MRKQSNWRRRVWPRAFCRDDSGSSTIEFLMWLPLLVLIILLATQATILFMTQAKYGSVARDTARLVSRYAMTAESAEDWILEDNTLTPYVDAASVLVESGRVTVSLSAPATALILSDVLRLGDDFRVSARVVYAMEPE